MTDRLEQIKGVYFGEREPACTHQIFYTGCDMCSRSWLISELEQHLAYSPANHKALAGSEAA
jgi:hypothetical protein